MVGVTTVALIERRPDISRDLFTRYWRDVHGVMAARIPGFESYTQYHVTPVGDAAPFEGVAIVTFASEADRQGLATSEVAGHIHRDEQNVFRRALLYNLDATAAQSSGSREGAADQLFLVVPDGVDAGAILAAVKAEAPVFCHFCDLRSGDPAQWNHTDVGGERPFVALIHAGWDDASAALEAIDGPHVYRLDETHIMVEGGFPTPVGLRGLDAVRTIEEAKAVNQLAPEVVRAVYGAALAIPIT